MSRKPDASKGHHQSSPALNAAGAAAAADHCLGAGEVAGAPDGEAGAGTAAAANSRVGDHRGDNLAGATAQAGGSVAEPSVAVGPVQARAPDLAADAEAGQLADAPAIVNIEEFARLAGKSVPTIRAYIRDGLPVVSEGQHGVEYEIDARAAAAWIKARDDAAAAERQGRRKQLAALQVELFGESIDPEVEQLTPEQRAKVAAAKYQENRLAEQQGALVRVDDVRHCADVAFSTLQRELRALATDVAKTYGLPREARVGIEARIKAALKSCATKLGDQTAYEFGPGERRSLDPSLRLVSGGGPVSRQIDAAPHENSALKIGD